VRTTTATIATTTATTSNLVLFLQMHPLLLFHPLHVRPLLLQHVCRLRQLLFLYLQLHLQLLLTRLQLLLLHPCPFKRPRPARDQTCCCRWLLLLLLLSWMLGASYSVAGRQREGEGAVRLL
jgi:hypothetical protein